MATWKKVIVSGSQADLAAVSASIALRVGTNQIITTSTTTTVLSGSFSGSFFGNGSSLSGIVATNVSITNTDTGFVNTDFVIMSSSAGLSKITYTNFLTDLTNAADSNLEVDGATDGIRLKSQISVTGISGSHSGSFFGNGSGLTAIPYSSLTSVPSGIVSASSLASSTQGQVTLTTNGVGVTTNLNSLQAADTPTFAGINANGVSFGLATATATAIQIGGSGATVTVPGNLTVNGTTTIINTTNTEIKDSFILLASGSSSSATDGGIIVQGATQGTGSAFYWDGGLNRWAVANSIASSLPGATGITTPNSFIVTVSGSSGDPIGDPYYGAAAASRIGNMYVDTSLTGPSDNNIWIWA